MSAHKDLEASYDEFKALSIKAESEAKSAADARGEAAQLKHQLAVAQSELDSYQIKCQESTARMVAAVEAAAAAEAKSSAFMALFSSEMQSAADARCDAESKGAELDIALSACETLQLRLLEAEAKMQKMAHCELLRDAASRAKSPVAPTSPGRRPMHQPHSPARDDDALRCVMC